jgi:formate-dependent phosphoribosylglycinamide formyltransferase (GAR transformylase)
MVLRDHYQQAPSIIVAARDIFVDMAETEFERELYERIWPYQNR